MNTKENFLEKQGGKLNADDQKRAEELGLQPQSGMTIIVPKIPSDQDESIKEKVTEFVNLVKEDPTNLGLSRLVFNLGKDSADSMIPHVALFEKKMAALSAFAGEESPANKTLLELKMQVDSTNPAVLRKQDMFIRGGFLIKRMLPSTKVGEKIMKHIYENRETVQSTISGLDKDLLIIKDGLYQNLSDIQEIFNGLLAGHKGIELDIYKGKLMFNQLKPFADSLEPGVAKHNVEKIVATLTKKVNDLQTEVNANIQFFTGAIAMFEVSEVQIDNIDTMSRLLKRSVLANLGLRVSAAELAQSVNITEQMSQTIGDTIADTGAQLNKMGDQMTKARSTTAINLEKLEEGCQQLEQFFKNQAIANKAIIEEGQKVGNKLTGMTESLKQHIADEDGNIHEADFSKD